MLDQLARAVSLSAAIFIAGRFRPAWYWQIVIVVGLVAVAQGTAAAIKFVLASRNK